MTACCPSCATVQGTNKFFSKQAKRYLKQFRKRGLAKEQRYLVEGIELSSLDGKSILEIGCGVGALHLTMLKHGAKSATGIDISEGMLEGAKKLSAELGLNSRVTYHLGDFAKSNESIGDADITVLDKVVCCYEDVDDLLQKSLSKTRRIYALSFPKPNIFVHSFFQVPILLAKILRWSFRPYWHDWNGIVRKIEGSGFRETYRKTTFIWAVHVFERT